MAGVFPFEVEVHSAPQGHGYVELLVDAPNPFFPAGTTIQPGDPVRFLPLGEWLQ